LFKQFVYPNLPLVLQNKFGFSDASIPLKHLWFIRIVAQNLMVTKGEGFRDLRNSCNLKISNFNISKKKKDI